VSIYDAWAEISLQPRADSVDIVKRFVSQVANIARLRIDIKDGYRVTTINLQFLAGDMNPQPQDDAGGVRVRNMAWLSKHIMG
jgi:hypothetical protein